MPPIDQYLAVFMSGLFMARARIDGIDFWRDFALQTIFIDHVSGNIFSYATIKNFGFSDAAEIFVFSRACRSRSLTATSFSMVACRRACGQWADGP
jgi:hypothetical protein